MSTAKATLGSSIIMLFIKMVHRSIGIVSMLVLSRLLDPEDFGIVAIATVIVFFCDILTETGTQQYIVNKNTIDDLDLSTSFTLNLMLKTSVAVVVFIGSPWLAIFFEKPELEGVVKVIILILPLSALANPGLNLYKRELNYRPIMRLLITEKVFSFAIAMIGAFLFRNYWAMILGVVSGYLYKTVGTYYVHTFRPTLTLARVKEQWTFSQWMLLKGISGYSKSEFDTFILSKLFSFDIVGGFSLMKGLSAMPGRDIIRPMTEPLLATFSKARNDEKNLRHQVQMSIGVLLSGTVPIAVFLWQFDEAIVRLLFDERWWGYAPILGVLSILIVNYSLVSILQEALIAVDKIKLLFYYDVISLLFLISVLLSMKFDDIHDFTVVRVAVSVLTILPLTLIAFQFLKLHWLAVLQLIGVCTVPSFVAVLGTNAINEVLSFSNHFVFIAFSGLCFLLLLLLAYGAILFSVSTKTISTFKTFVVKLFSMVLSFRRT